MAAEAVCGCPINEKAAHTRRHVAQVDRRGAGPAKYDISLAGAKAAGAGDDHVVQSVAVDIAGVADGPADLITSHSVDDKASDANLNVAEQYAVNR